MTGNDILHRAISLITDISYHRKHATAFADGPQTSVIDPLATKFSISGLIERAGTVPNGLTLRADHRDAVAEGKALMCLSLRTMHLDYWEERMKPDWQAVRQVFIHALSKPVEPHEAP